MPSTGVLSGSASLGTDGNQNHHRRRRILQGHPSATEFDRQSGEAGSHPQPSRSHRTVQFAAAPEALSSSSPPAPASPTPALPYDDTNLWWFLAPRFVATCLLASLAILLLLSSRFVLSLRPVRATGLHLLRGMHSFAQSLEQPMEELLGPVISAMLRMESKSALTGEIGPHVLGLDDIDRDARPYYADVSIVRRRSSSSSSSKVDHFSSRQHPADATLATRTSVSSPQSPLLPEDALFTSPAEDCGYGVLFNVSAAWPKGPTPLPSSNLYACICPVDRTGPRCDTDRPARCDLTRLLPVFSNPSCASVSNKISAASTFSQLDASTVKTSPLLGFPSCIEATSDATVQFSYSLQCQYVDLVGFGWPPAVSLPGGFPSDGLEVPLLPTDAAANGLSIVKIGSLARTSLVLDQPQNVSARTVFSSFHYDAAASNASSYRTDIGDFPFSITDRATVDGRLSFDCVAFDGQFLLEMPPSSTVSVNVSLEEFVKEQPIVLSVDISALPMQVKRFGRIYLECGFPFNKSVAYVADESSLADGGTRLAGRLYDAQVIDLTDYREPPASPVGSLWMLVVVLVATSSVSLLLVLYGIYAYHTEIKRVTQKRHEFLKRKQLAQ